MMVSLAPDAADTLVSVPALLAALTAVLLVRAIAPPRRRLARRLRPYASLGRSRLGTAPADASVSWLVEADDRPVMVRLFAPSVQRVADQLGAVVDATDSETQELRLRQAGFVTIDVRQHRMRQLAWTVAGLALGTALGIAVLASVSGTALLMVAFGFPAATVQRNRVERAIDGRRARMRTEVYTVAQLVAVYLRTGHGPVEAIRSVCTTAKGPVAEELREALGWMTSGVGSEDAYGRLAATTPEPAAARLYRLLGASARSGGDIADALLAVAADLRAERRDDIARSAVKRRTAMLAPLLLLIAPVMVLFVGAALPSLVLGPVR